MAQDYINTARSCLREAREAFGEGNFSLCVRRAQECIELSIRAVLRILAIEFPKEHDVSDIFQGLDGFELPGWFKENLIRTCEHNAEDNSKERSCLIWF
jgi:HEPN domain-containing protein